jgi:TRAP-type C4-dicarboxylate transport system permease small subunit
MILVDRLSEAIGRALAWVLLAVALLSWMEVFLRYLLRAPTVWAPEIIQAMTATVFLFAGSVAMSRDMHIRITPLHDALPRGAQRAVAALCLAAALLFLGGLLWGAWNQFVGSVWRFSGDRWTPEMTGRAWNVPLPPVTRGLMVLACVLLMVQATVTYGRHILGLPPRRAAVQADA